MNAVAPALARLDVREQLMAAAMRATALHLAAGDPVDPDPDHQPKHYRRTHG